ncbi:MAG: TrkA C-terminal domain-containing protein [Pelovirga sp.]
MLGIIGVIALLTVLGLSMVVTRMATIALAKTGLSYTAAEFQARSAFTGTGFTTQETESVVTHPVRRRIIMFLMLLRSAGIVSILLSLILSFMGTEESDRMIRLLWLLGGILMLWLLSKSTFVDRGITAIMNWALRNSPELGARDYVSLLQLSGDYLIRELGLKEGDWLVDKQLRDCDLFEEGISVLGIHREEGGYVGVPKPDTRLYPGDRVVLYGRSQTISELDERRSGSKGDQEHGRAVGTHRRHMERQDREEDERDIQRSKQRDSAG